MTFAADRETSGRPWKPGDQTNRVRKVIADAEVADAYGTVEGSPVYERQAVQSRRKASTCLDGGQKTVGAARFELATPRL